MKKHNKGASGLVPGAPLRYNKISYEIEALPMKICSKLLALLLTISLITVPAGALSAEQARELLNTYYVDGVPERVLEQTTVEDMLKALGDPYTEYFDAATYAAFMDSMKDSVTYGVGVTMQVVDNGILITDVLPDLGAAKAGMKAGDVITAVDGVPTAGAALETVRTQITGEAGTTVKLTVLRGGTTRSYTVTRAKVVIAATQTELVDGHIGYIACDTFGPETQGHFEEGVTEHDYKVDRWIVDLRNNGGGDVEASVQAAGTFAGGGELAYLRDNEGQYGVHYREEGGLTLDPVVVLTSPYTASASEIFAFIVRDRQAGLIVGERTYGKGVAQVLLDDTVEPTYFEDGSALKVTTYRIFSPNGTTDDRVGVIPHLLVDPVLAEGVGLLLAGSNPKGDTTGKLRLDMGWRWYVDLKTAVAPEMRPAFTALLEAIPESAKLWRGTGGADGWVRATAAEVAEKYALTDYAARGFTDTADSPYADQISALATYGVVSGTGDGTFRPEEALTRGQLCALLAQALRYTSDHTGTFADVSGEAYYAPAVEAMYAEGLVTGGTDGLFHPEAPIDHQQLMTILARAAARLSMNFDGALRSDHAEALSHEALVPYAKWARESVWLLDGSQTNPIGQGVSLLWDSLDNIAPHAPTTRQEAAAAIYNILSYTGIIPA